MLNHAAIAQVEALPMRLMNDGSYALARTASVGATLSPSEAGAAAGKADKEKGEPEDLNYGGAHFGAEADQKSAQRAYSEAYNAASKGADNSWVLWLGLVMASGLAFFAYAFGGKKSPGSELSTGMPPEDREASLPPEPQAYGLGAGSSYGAW